MKHFRESEIYLLHRAETLPELYVYKNILIGVDEVKPGQKESTGYDPSLENCGSTHFLNSSLIVTNRIIRKNTFQS